MARSMPYSPEAEQALLASMIMYPSSVTIANDEGLMVDDFYLEANRKIYNVIQIIHNEGKLVDATTLISKLSDFQVLQQVGGMDYIMQLSDISVAPASMKYYIEIVQDKASTRRLIETTQQIAEEGLEGQTSLEILMDKAEKEILNVTRARKTGDFKKSREVVKNVLDNIHKMSENHHAVTGVETQFRDLDRTTNGFQRGDLIILAARPSVGKTAFALNLALRVSQIQADEAVAIFSLEMPAEQLVSRMLSAQSMVPANNLRTGYLTNEEWRSVDNAAERLSATKINIDDTSNIRVSEIFSKCRKLKAEQGLSLVVIDYIQLISGNGKNSDNRQQEVSDISRSLKALARELDVPVIALSQLSRSVEKREDKRPMLSDLRESGALEQDADLVILMYREEYYKKEKSEEATEKTEINIAKHRNGATRLINLAFQRDISAFFDYKEE